jgi:hypothetical protein
VRRSLTVLAAAALAVVLSACGSAQQSAENMVNDALGGSASVDMGEDGEVRVDTSDGSMEFGTGNFPEGWPEDLGVIPGFELLAAATTPEALTVQMYAEGDQSAAVDAYVKDLQANKGWAVDPTVPPGTPNMWALTKDGQVVMILSGPNSNDTVVAFSLRAR